MRRDPFEGCEIRPALELADVCAHGDEEVLFSRVPSAEEEFIDDELIFLACRRRRASTRRRPSRSTTTKATTSIS